MWHRFSIVWMPAAGLRRWQSVCGAGSLCSERLFLRLAQCHGEGEVKRGSGIRPAFGPDASSVALHDFAADGQSDSGAWDARTVQALEQHEDLLAVVVVEADAVVRHRDLPLLAALLRRNMDLRGNIRPPVLDRIAEQ